MQLTLKEQIICHINYRSVFNAPVEREALISWLFLQKTAEEIALFDAQINELIAEKLIVECDGYFTTYDKQQVIAIQPEKKARTLALMLKGQNFIRYFSKIPFIRYVGVSGSVAANNPTTNSAEHVDLDLFVICSKNSLWIIFFFERIFTNLVRLVKGDHFYCFNYVTDISFLEIYNQNFFTATEIINLKTLVDKDVYDEFLLKNSWVQRYYNIKLNDAEPNGSLIEKTNFLMGWINRSFYGIFNLFRGIKNLNIRYAFESTSRFDPTQKCNLNRISNPNGGYQEKIKQRFSDLMKQNFKEFYSLQIIDFLFPAKSSFNFSEEENSHDFLVAENFEKYV